MKAIKFVKAMAANGDKTERAWLMNELHKKSGYISTYKKRLVKAGVIQELESGVFSFALPGFRDYILEML